jgi:hypothetical protein
MMDVPHDLFASAAGAEADRRHSGSGKRQSSKIGAGPLSDAARPHEPTQSKNSQGATARRSSQSNKNGAIPTSGNPLEDILRGDAKMDPRIGRSRRENALMPTNDFNPDDYDPSAPTPEEGDGGYSLLQEMLHDSKSRAAPTPEGGVGSYHGDRNSGGARRYSLRDSKPGSADAEKTRASTALKEAAGAVGAIHAAVAAQETHHNRPYVAIDAPSEVNRSSRLKHDRASGDRKSSSSSRLKHDRSSGGRPGPPAQPAHPAQQGKLDEWDEWDDWDAHKDDHPSSHAAEPPPQMPLRGALGVQRPGGIRVREMSPTRAAKAIRAKVTKEVKVLKGAKVMKGAKVTVPRKAVKVMKSTKDMKAKKEMKSTKETKAKKERTSTKGKKAKKERTSTKGKKAMKERTSTKGMKAMKANKVSSKGKNQKQKSRSKL